MQLVNEVFYNGANQTLFSKLKLTDLDKTGNHVLNINMILNHLKKDTNIQLHPTIKNLNTFNIL